MWWSPACHLWLLTLVWCLQLPRLLGADSGEQVQVTVPTIPKCCPVNESLVQGVGCDFTDLPFEPEFGGSEPPPTLIDLMVGLPCRNHSFQLDPAKNPGDQFELLANGSLYLPQENPPLLLAQSQFCLESFLQADGSVLVLPIRCFTPATVCPPVNPATDIPDPSPCSPPGGELVRISKCCPVNMSYAMGTNECQKLGAEFKPEFWREEPVSPHQVDFVVGFKCTSGKFLLDPEENSEDEFHLLANGSLLLPFQSPSLLSPHEYCLESFRSGGEDRLLPLICFPEWSDQEAGRDIPSLLYTIGMLVSVPFLVVTCLVFACIPRLRDTQGKILCSYVCCLAAGFTTLAVTQLLSPSFSTHLCIAIAYVIQFLFLACFFWLNIMSLHLWLRLRGGGGGKRERKRWLLACYAAYGWAGPGLVVAVSVVMDQTPAVPASYLKPDFGVHKCWFHSDKAAFNYFYAPISCLLLLNLVLFLLSARVLCAAAPQLSRLIHLRRILLQCLVLFLVMGLSWVAEVVSFWLGGPATYWILTDILNSLQGPIIFYIFVWREPAIRYMAMSKFLPSATRRQPTLERTATEGSELLTTSHPVPDFT